MAYRTQPSAEKKLQEQPQSHDAEQAVLGAILKDNDALNQVIEVLPAENLFYFPRHRSIYKVMIDLYARSEPCDLTTVANALQIAGELDRTGGRVYLVELAESVATTANVVSYSNIILEKAMLRALINTSNEISRSCYNQEQPVEQLLDQAESSIFKISESRLRKSFVSIRELIPSTFDQIENLQSDKSSLVGIKTGFTQLDIMTNGFHNGDMVVIAGRPSMGKTALTMNIVEHIAIEQKKPVGVFSIEMSDEALALRMLCGRARISQQKLRAGKLRTDEWPRLTAASGPLSVADIYIDDSPTLSVLEMRAKARRLKAQHPDLALIVVDYLQLMHGTGRFENRQQEMSSISRGLKALAKELSIPVVACSQLSRQVEQRGKEKRPQLSDLRESGAIEQDADLVMFVYREELYYSHLEKTDPKFLEVEGKAEVIISKQRNGPTGLVNLSFIKDLARFENLAPGYRELPPGAEPVTDADAPF